MADIKTRDAVKGTIKTLDKAAIAGERMKSAYAKTKDKAEQGYYAEENSPTEYASDKVSRASGRIRDEGIHQFNKQGQKNVQTTKENIGRAKDKIAEFKTKRAVKAVEAVSADGVDIFLTAVGDYLVYPQADQLLHRRVSGRGEAQAQQPGQRQGKQLSFHHQVPFQHGFIRQTGTPAILYLFCSNFTRCRRILQGSPAIRNGIVTKRRQIIP